MDQSVQSDQMISQRWSKWQSECQAIKSWESPWNQDQFGSTQSDRISMRSVTLHSDQISMRSVTLYSDKADSMGAGWQPTCTASAWLSHPSQDNLDENVITTKFRDKALRLSIHAQKFRQRAGAVASWLVAHPQGFPPAPGKSESEDQSASQNHG
eukprot:3459810-Amphidinium_carterae.2